MKQFPINSKENKQRALKAVMDILGEDGMEVVIRKRVVSGTTEQQAWFNMLCKMVADETGDSPDAVKAAIKKETFGLRSAQPVDDGKVHHFAFVWDHEAGEHGRASLYIDGLLHDEDDLTFAPGYNGKFILGKIPHGFLNNLLLFS